MTDSNATHTRESDEVLRVAVAILNAEELPNLAGWGPEGLRAASEEVHSGDCTRQAWTCNACYAERAIDVAKAAIAAMNTPIPLTPSDGKAVPTEAEWRAFLKANETMHCPVCGSNKRKPNGGAACGCNVTWVVDAPTPAPITPSDEMVEAGAKALWAHGMVGATDEIWDMTNPTEWENEAKACLQAALNLMGGKK